MSDRIVGSTVIATERLDALLAERDAALTELVTVREHLPIGYAGSLVDAIEEFMEQANTAMDLRGAALPRIATLEAALRPFVRTYHPNVPDNSVTQISVSVADLRAAAAALADAPAEKP